MTDRDTKRISFLTAISWNNATSIIIAGDASNRSYERLTQSDGRKAILMNAPPEKGEDVRPFVKILKLLRMQNLSAPDLLGVDAQNGFLLLEDLGDDLFVHVCRTKPQLEETLYKAAIDALLSLRKASAPTDIAPYDIATYIRETDLVTQWYIPATTGLNADDAAQDSYHNIIRDCCGAIQNDQSVIVLRDYHAENLLWLPNRKSTAKVGLLDFQDALIGHPAYDLVSLLEDARRDTSNKLQQDMLGYYLSKSGDNADAFHYAYATLGAQRNLKIIGIFARLCMRDNKLNYVDLIPRVWAHLQRDLNHPNLSALKDWVSAHVAEPTPDVLARIKECAS